MVRQSVLVALWYGFVLVLAVFVLNVEYDRVSTFVLALVIAGSTRNLYVCSTFLGNFVCPSEGVLVRLVLN